MHSLNVRVLRKYTMAPLNLKDKFRNGELDLSSCGLKEIPKDIVRISTILVACSFWKIFLIYTKCSHHSSLLFLNNCQLSSLCLLLIKFFVFWISSGIEISNNYFHFFKFQTSLKHVTSLNLSNNKISSVGVSISLFDTVF